MGPKLILIGPPGAGKSSIGRQLSKVLEVPFRDTDVLVEEKAGKKISDIFVDDGESAFRKIEREVVLKEISTGNGVLALGGGSVLDEEVAEKLESLKSNVIYLEVSISNAAPRVGFNKDRPLLAVNPRQQWLNLMEKRKPIYERLCGVKVSTDNKKPNEVVAEIRELMNR
jgi:shikimate kinase